MTDKLLEEHAQLGKEIDELSAQHEAIEKRLKEKLARWNTIGDTLKRKYNPTPKYEPSDDYGGKSKKHGGK